MKLIKLADVKDLLPLLDKEEITLSRFAELLNERANKALNTEEVNRSVCSCGSLNYGYGFAKCYDCEKIKDV
jgi:hypothetical protein